MSLPLLITDLPAIAGTDVAASTDVIPIVDVSNGPNGKASKLTVQELIANTSSFVQSGIGAGPTNLQGRGRQVVYVTDFYADGVGTSSTMVDTTGTVDSTLGIRAAITRVTALGGTVVFPVGTYKVTSTLTLTDGIRLEGQGAPNYWRSTKSPTKIAYSGTGSCITVAPASAVVADSIQLSGLHLDGTGASGSVDGLFLDQSAGGGGGIEGVLVENCAITNFPRYQVLHDTNVFAITYKHCSFNNLGRAADNCVHIRTATPSQIVFDDCEIIPATAGKWGAYQVTGNNVIFIGGAVLPQGSGVASNGIYVSGGLSIYGTHLEGTALQTGTIGIQYVGDLGGMISPSICASFGTGIKIGDGTASNARGWTISGSVGNYNAGGNGDVHITAGGSRIGTILSLGYSVGTPTITNDRYGTDAVQDVNIGNDVDWTLGGSISLKSLGSGLKIKEGTNAVMGLATLSSGAATVSTTKVTANSRIFITHQADGSNVSWVRVSSRTPGTSFVISSADGADTSTVAWVIVEPL